MQFNKLLEQAWVKPGDYDFGTAVWNQNGFYASIEGANIVNQREHKGEMFYLEKRKSVFTIMVKRFDDYPTKKDPNGKKERFYIVGTMKTEQSDSYKRIEYITENMSETMFKDNTKRVYFAMRVTIDESPSIPRDKTVWATDNDFTKLALVASIVTPERNKKLPTYNVLASEKINLPTHDWNTLNCISLCLPIIFYVIRDPQILDLYSVVGSTNVINFVDMYNMSSGRLMNADYPVEKSKYQCFTIYTRRNLQCMIGYSGLAFLQEGE